VRPHKCGVGVPLHFTRDEIVRVLVRGLFGGRIEFQYFYKQKPCVSSIKYNNIHHGVIKIRYNTVVDSGVAKGGGLRGL
jgi:hypothetical protein